MEDFYVSDERELNPKVVPQNHEDATQAILFVCV
jgi:hypothetical protein